MWRYKLIYHTTYKFISDKDLSSASASWYYSGRYNGDAALEGRSSVGPPDERPAVESVPTYLGLGGIDALSICLVKG